MRFDDGMSDHDHNSQTHEHNDPEHRYAFYAVVILMCLLAFIAAKDVWRSSTQKKTRSDTSTTVLKQQPDEPEANLIEARPQSAFPELNTAMTIINASQGKSINDPTSESLANGIVEAEEERVVYFATVATPSIDETDSEIYQMNTVSKRWQRMYKQAFKKNQSDHFYRVIGRKGNELLLFEDRKNRKDLPCQSFWVIGQTDPYQILSLDILNPYNPMKPWAVPEGLIASEKQRVATCGK